MDVRESIRKPHVLLRVAGNIRTFPTKTVFSSICDILSFSFNFFSHSLNIGVYELLQNISRLDKICKNCYLHRRGTGFISPTPPPPPPPYTVGWSMGRCTTRICTVTGNSRTFISMCDAASTKSGMCYTVRLPREYAKSHLRKRMKIVFHSNSIGECIRSLIECRQATNSIYIYNNMVMNKHKYK